LQRAFSCPKCGAQISIGQQVCSACGEKFEYRCAQCSAIVEAGRTFCTNCGAKLYKQTRLIGPSSESGKRIHQQRQKAKQRKTSSLSIGQLGAFLGFIAIVLCLGAIFYSIGTDSQGQSSSGLGRGFIFSGKPPTSPPNTEAKNEQASVPAPVPTPVPDLPRYTADQVTTVAKSLSPDCQALAKRTG
jgi:DNA-directed RNA polymerase subunit RPC12/RpoP